jgi:hypothetical protein
VDLIVRGVFTQRSGMVKKIFDHLTAAIFFLIIPVTTLQAADMVVEAKGAYFYPTDSKFRKIYSNRGMYGTEYTCQAWKWLYGWASASYYSSWGSSIHLRHRTHIYFIPLALGPKYFHRFTWGDIYVGVGGMGTYLHMRDHSPFVIHRPHKWGFGGIAKAGILVKLYRNFFIDFFSDYSYMKIDFHNTDHGKVQRHIADLSGLSIGGGIGYRF